MGSLPAACAVVGAFDAVVEGVANQVVEGGFELFEDVAIDAGLFAEDLEADLLVELAGDVADQAGEAADAVRKGRRRLEMTSWWRRSERSSLRRAWFSMRSMWWLSSSRRGSASCLS